PFIPDAQHYHPGLVGCRIRIVDGDPAPPELPLGVTFIKSPKGSGKTEAMTRLTRGMQRVLLIGHRRALINQSCERLQLVSYLKSTGRPDVLGRFGVCLDSLAMVPPHAVYDTIILDESEQLLAHFLSETLERLQGGGRDRIFGHFGRLIARAK